MADIAKREFLSEQDVIDRLVDQAPELSEVQRAKLFTLIEEVIGQDV